MSIRFRARKTVRVWPFYWNFSTNGFTSWGIRIWRYNRNFARGTSSFNTPGLGSLHWGGKGRRSR